MKTHDILYLLLICLSTAWISCEKSADQTVTFKSILEENIQFRAGSCENCGEDDCCCGFELRNDDDPTYFRICGFNNGTNTCTPTPPSGCSTIDGGFIVQLLNNDDDKFAFCMLQGNCFQITNLTFGSTGEIRISCDYDQVSPNFTNVTIPYLSTYTFCVEGTCEFGQCHP